MALRGWSARGSTTDVLDLAEARRQNEAWRTWIVSGRPYVILKLAALARRPGDGARSALGDGGSRASAGPRAARDGGRRCRGNGHRSRRCAEARRARRAGRRGSPGGSRSGTGRSRTSRRSSCRSGSLEDELGALGREGVQSLLLEGGPTIATAVLTRGLVDRLLLFIAPVLSGGGPAVLGALPEPIDLPAPMLEQIGDDVLVDVRLREIEDFVVIHTKSDLPRRRVGVGR